MMRCRSAQLTVALEGIVGAGKTSLFEGLKSNAAFNANLDVNYLDEPLEKFQSFLHQHNPLKNSYQFPKSDAAIAQLHITNVLAEHLENAFSLSSQVNLFDRGPETGLVFVNAYRDMGYFSPFATDFILHHLAQSIQSKFRPGFIIYLDTSLDLALDRIAIRDRFEEAKFDRNFLAALKENYEKYLEKQQIPVVKIEISPETQLKEIIHQASCAIQKKVVDGI